MEAGATELAGLVVACMESPLKARLDWSPGALCHAPEPTPTIEMKLAGVAPGYWAATPSKQIQDTARDTISGVWTLNNHYL